MVGWPRNRRPWRRRRLAGKSTVGARSPAGLIATYRRFPSGRAGAEDTAVPRGIVAQEVHKAQGARYASQAREAGMAVVLLLDFAVTSRPNWRREGTVYPPSITGIA